MRRRYPVPERALHLLRRGATLVLLLLFLAPVVRAEVLTADTVWSGEILVSEDILVPAGVSLTVMPGTVVRVEAADSTKTDPEYVSHRTEITVRGVLRVRGEEKNPVLFGSATPGGEDLLNAWGGIIIDAGTAEIARAVVSGAETGITVLHGTLTASGLSLVENRYGMLVQGEDSVVELRFSTVSKNDYGVFLLNGASFSRLDSTLAGNSKRDFYSGKAVPRRAPESYTVAERVTGRIYRDEALLGMNLWQGKVLIDGLVRIPPEAVLFIMPGTVVEFSRRDTNGDGIGENGLMIQGRLVAKGTKDAPIIFRSAEADRSMGDWDSINILGSDRVQNLIEFCRIEDAYRGMHFHFANVAVTHSLLQNNYRGAQFQESLVTMRYNTFFGNRSGLQARDSEVIFVENEVVGNHNGANFFRLDLEARQNLFANNEEDGLRVREGVSRLVENRMLGNRFGLLVADANYVEVEKNLISGNLESGLALRNSDHVRVSANALVHNGINGMIIRASRGVISGNAIAANGDRGIAIVSFSGFIRNNNIFANKVYAIGLDGESDVDAAGNWWAGADLAAAIYDSNDEKRLGSVTYREASPDPFVFSWVWPTIETDAAWGGTVLVPARVTVAPGATLSVLPGTTVAFGPGTGLEIFGRIDSRGTETNRIHYTAAARKEPGAWGEISLQQAGASVFAYSDFSFATWGIHSHFTPLTIAGCRFTDNDGGLRFRSGPLDISGSVFRGNGIGIRSFRGIGRIRSSDISGNSIGIFVREKGASFALEYNNLYGNERYSLRLGDFNREDVDARHNWWGGEEPAEEIFDHEDESYIGRVHFAPVLSGPVDIIVQQ